MSIDNLLRNVKKSLVRVGLGLTLVAGVGYGCGGEEDETCDLTNAINRYNSAYLEKQECFNANEIKTWDCEKESSCGSVDSINLCAEEYESMSCGEYANDYLSDNCEDSMLFLANHCKMQISLVYCPPHYRRRGFCD